ncbi:MAG TPA: LLM class flavin-dependent oxidoreductase [Anaerolineae bacterium]|nr:LLM class flavin-dependent oxidoreductase [Anaerolineae bacterium]
MPARVSFGIGIIPSEPPDEFIERVRLAEELGFDSIWVADFRLYRDVYVSLALAALSSTHLRLGVGITNPYTRHPALTAAGIASVDALSNGRALLGVGAGGVVLDLLQIKQREPILACRRAVEMIRRYLSGNPVRGTGKPVTSASNVRLDFPTRPDLPIFIAATGLKMLTLAGEIGDGVIINVGAYPACIDGALAAVGNGAWGVKRPRQSLEMLCWLQGCAVHEDAQVALDAVKPVAALTLAYAPAWMMEAMEIDDEVVKEIRRAFSAEGREAAGQLVPNELVEKFAVVGTPEQCIRKLKQIRAKGFEEIIVRLAQTNGGQIEAMSTFAEQVIKPMRADTTLATRAAVVERQSLN